MSTRIYLIEDFFGAQTFRQQDPVTLRRNADGINSIYISAKDCLYPMIHVLVNGDNAVIHYFESEETAGFLSQNNSRKNISRLETFFENESGTEIKFPADAVVNHKAAEKAAGEFVARNNFPESLDWLEL